MAPEILSGKGYDFMVDLWSLGVIIFEFMCGYLPFGEDCDDPYQIFEEIMMKSLEFPDYMKSETAKSFILQLLNKKPESRLMGSYDTLKNNKFFDGIDWCDLIEKKIKSPFEVPKEFLTEIRE